MDSASNNGQYDSIKNNPKLKAVFWVLFSVSVFFIVYILRFYFWPALFALLVYIILKPIYTKLNNRFPGHENLIAMLLLMGAFFLIFLPTVYILVAVSHEAIKASALIKQNVKFENLPQLLSNTAGIQELLKQFKITPQEITTKALSFAQQASNFVVAQLTGFIKGSLGLAFDMILMTVILFFFLREGEKVERQFYSIMPFPDDLEKQIAERTARVIRDVFYGNIIIMIAQGTGIFILFVIFDVPSAILWAVIGGIFSIIPIISTSVVWVPTVIYFIISGSYTSAIILGVLALAIAQTLENVVKPKILDKKLNIHPLVLFFALFGGLQAFGLVGLILGPVIITIFMTFMEAYRVIEEFTPKQVSEDEMDS